MAWLYLPVSVGLNSVSNNSSLQAESFVMSRGKPLAPQSLSRKWKKESYMKLLYGLMLEPSKAQSLVEKWILSVPDSLVNHSVKLENSKEKKMNVGSGMILKESLARFDLNSSSWKTFQTSLMGELIPFSEPWPNSGSMLNMVVSKCPKLAETITEIDSSYLHIVPKEGGLWPTPTASHLKIYPTPIASDSTKTNLTHHGKNLTLLGAVKFYATPTASDGHNSTLPPSQANWDSLPGDMIRLGEARPGGVLNPQFVEWLMGWPIGWTDLEHVGTESSLIRHIEHILNSSKEQ